MLVQLLMTGIPLAVAVTACTVDRSCASDLGRAVEPVFAPLGFDWRINIGIIALLSAREVFVATLGQVAAADDPEAPEAPEDHAAALEAMTVGDGPREGPPLVTAPVAAAIAISFPYALQCSSTIGVMRREPGTWRWPITASVHMFTLARVMAALARLVVGAIV